MADTRKAFTLFKIPASMVTKSVSTLLLEEEDKHTDANTQSQSCSIYQLTSEEKSKINTLVEETHKIEEQINLLLAKEDLLRKEKEALQYPDDFELQTLLTTEFNKYKTDINVICKIDRINSICVLIIKDFNDIELAKKYYQSLH